jgi:hypothetical protein
MMQNKDGVDNWLFLEKLIRQLAVFICCPCPNPYHAVQMLETFVFYSCTSTSSHAVDVGIQGLAPSAPTLIILSTWDQRRNCDPILVTVREYCILQLDVFVFCSYTRTSIRPGYAGIQGLAPSVMALSFRSTRNQRGNCSPILATVRLYCILQLVVFIFCPYPNTFSRQADVGIQGIMPSVTTLFFCSTRNQRGY